MQAHLADHELAEVQNLAAGYIAEEIRAWLESRRASNTHGQGPLVLNGLLIVGHAQRTARPSAIARSGEKNQRADGW